ncbi:MAG TPA: hypothetical protein VHZ53_05525 [Steroidobacteraceae bacterium]|jgi:hypothetical protein|nr:hypothetical protein [Steroidobacteraceae bacterium]
MRAHIVERVPSMLGAAEDDVAAGEVDAAHLTFGKVGRARRAKVGLGHGRRRGIESIARHHTVMHLRTCHGVAITGDAIAAGGGQKGVIYY